MATSLGLGQVNHLLVVVEGVVQAHMALDHLGLAPGAPHLHLAASFHLLTFFLNFFYDGFPKQCKEITCESRINRLQDIFEKSHYAFQ